MNVKRQHSTLNTTPQPWTWFKLQPMLMTLNQVKLYAKSGAELLNWVTGTKTARDLNMMSAHTANQRVSILN